MKSYVKHNYLKPPFSYMYVKSVYRLHLTVNQLNRYQYNSDHDLAYSVCLTMTIVVPVLARHDVIRDAVTDFRVFLYLLAG
jgi:hypothetical protein